MMATADSNPAGLPSAGRCDGIAGNAETTTGSPPCVGADPHCPCQDGDPCRYMATPGSPAMVVNHVGRLDRILAEQDQRIAERDAAASPYALEAEAAALAYAAAREPAEVVRLKAMVVALECEVAALTDALTAVTHEFDPAPSRMCEACFRPRGHPVHRTPARVRAELEGQ